MKPIIVWIIVVCLVWTPFYIKSFFPLSLIEYWWGIPFVLTSTAIVIVAIVFASVITENFFD